MDALASYTGVSTAPPVTPSIMPTSILFDTSTPSSVLHDPYTLQSLSPQLSSLMQSYSFPTGLSYTLSDYSATASNTQTALPSAASFYNSNGGIGVTNLPSSRRATMTQATTANTMVIAASSTTDSTPSATPADYNPNAASTKVGPSPM